MVDSVIGKPDPQTEKLLRAIFGSGPSEKRSPFRKQGDREVGRAAETEGAGDESGS